jgi:hypothetical protein
MNTSDTQSATPAPGVGCGVVLGVRWQTGTPDVKEGKRERFWCAVKVGHGKVGHCTLEYLNRHVMPVSDGLEPSPNAEPVPNSEYDEYYWTGWHEEACDQCETQWVYSGEVVAWMRLPRYSPNV